MALKRSDITLPVTLFYDGNCPLCLREINHLSRLNQAGQLQLVDIHSDGFAQRYPELDPEELDRFIHARLGDGIIVKGVDATLAAWEAVGKGIWIAPLRWPLMRIVADGVYRLFARNRHTISRRLAPLLGRNACKMDDK